MSEPNRYAVPVDPDGSNNAHSHMLQMVGHNKRVLELGAAGGHVTAALVGRGCAVTAVEIDKAAAASLDGVADRVLVGDLNDPAFRAMIADQYEVVCAGDVLEHLPDPQVVMNWAARRLAPGGKLVVSLPNVAHIDVRLALLQGAFTYQPTGLLDDSHLRFFTLDSVNELVAKAGLTIVDMRRVRQEPFCTEVGVDRDSVDPELVTRILEDPEARTYQFVFTAVRDDGKHQIETLAARYLALQAAAEDREIRAAQRLAEAARESERLIAEIAALTASLDEAHHTSAQLTQDLDRTRAVADQARAETVQTKDRAAALHAEIKALQAREVEVHASLRAIYDDREAMLQSQSWRWTRVLRTCGRLARRLVGR